MDSEQKIAKRDQVLSQACSWKDRKLAMRPLSGQEREKARTRLVEAENNLIEAAEQYEKEK